MDHRQVGRYWNGNAEAWTKLARAGYDVYRDYLNTPAFFQKAFSAPQKHPSPKRAISMPGQGPSMGLPFTKCFAGTGIRSSRPGSALSGGGITELRFSKNIELLQLGAVSSFDDGAPKIVSQLLRYAEVDTFAGPLPVRAGAASCL